MTISPLSARLAVLDDDEVAVADLLVDHRVALDAQHVGVALADEILRHRNGLGAGDRFDRHAGRDVAEHRQFERALPGARRQQLDRAAAVPGAADEALFLQVRQVLVHRGERRQAEAPADFLEARRVAVLLNELLQVVENLALAFGQWLHADAPADVDHVRRLYAKKKRKSTSNRGCWRAALKHGRAEPPQRPGGATSIALHGDAHLITLEIGADLARSGLARPHFLQRV